MPLRFCWTALNLNENEKLIEVLTYTVLCKLHATRYVCCSSLKTIGCSYHNAFLVHFATVFYFLVNSRPRIVEQPVEK